MIDAIDNGLSVGDQPGNDQASRSAQICRHDFGARQFGHALDDRGIALNFDAGAHATQLLDVHHPVFEDGFGNDRSPLGNRH